MSESDKIKKNAEPPGKNTTESKQTGERWLDQAALNGVYSFTLET